MKKLILLNSLFFLLFVIGGSETANAQKNQRLNSTPAAFQIFYARFRNAVVKRGKNTLASLTQFPFRYGFDTGDEGTFSKAQFLKRFDDIFNGEKKFFARKNPVFQSEAGTFNLTDTDDASHYVFEKKGTRYKFTTYIVEP